MYDLFHIGVNIRQNKLFYCLLLVELILCFILILVGLDESKTYQERTALYTQEVDDELLTLMNENFALYGEDVEIGHQVIEEHQVIAGKVYLVGYQGVGGKLDYLQFVEVTPQFFKTYFHFSPRPKTYYTSDAFVKRVNYITSILEENVQLSVKELNIQGKSYSLDTLPLSNKTISMKRLPTTMFEDGDIVLDKAVFYVTGQENIGIPQSVFFKINSFQEGKNIVNALNPLLQFPVYPTQLLTEFKRGSNQLAAFVRLFGWIAVIAFIIVILGMSAMILLFMSRRKQKLCIQYFFGASLWRLKCQIFGEILSIMLVALGFSWGITILIEPKVSSGYYTITSHLESISIVFGLILVLSFVITLLTSYRVEWAVIKERE